MVISMGGKAAASATGGVVLILGTSCGLSGKANLYLGDPVVGTAIEIVCKGAGSYTKVAGHLFLIHIPAMDCRYFRGAQTVSETSMKATATYIPAGASGAGVLTAVLT